MNTATTTTTTTDTSQADAAAAAQAQAAAAEATRIAAEAAATKAAEKAAKKAEADAAKAQKKIDAEAAKAKKKADAEAKKQADAEAKLQKKAAAEAAKLASKMPTQNGVTRPKPETLCGKVWGFADHLSQQLGQPVPIAQLLETTNANGLNEGNAKAEYARWRKFNGVTGRVTLPTPAVATTGAATGTDTVAGNGEAQATA